jgi:hypothetical protein
MQYSMRIYINIFFHVSAAPAGLGLILVEVSAELRHTTLGKIPLDE